jgi:hypothetical protein
MVIQSRYSRRALDSDSSTSWPCNMQWSKNIWIILWISLSPPSRLPGPVGLLHYRTESFWHIPNHLLPLGHCDTMRITLKLVLSTFYFPISFIVCTRSIISNICNYVIIFKFLLILSQAKMASSIAADITILTTHTTVPHDITGLASSVQWGEWKHFSTFQRSNNKMEKRWHKDFSHIRCYLSSHKKLIFILTFMLPFLKM